MRNNLMQALAIIAIAHWINPVALPAYGSDETEQWTVYQENRNLRLSLLALDDETQALKSETSSLKKEMADVKARLESVEGITAEHTGMLGQLKDEIKALDAELQRRLNAKLAPNTIAENVPSETSTTITAGFAPSRSHTETPSSTKANNIVAAFGITSSHRLATIEFTAGNFYLEIPDTDSSTIRGKVSFCDRRPCTKCVDIHSFRFDRTGERLTLVWHPCKQQYLVVIS